MGAKLSFNTFMPSVHKKDNGKLFLLHLGISLKHTYHKKKQKKKKKKKKKKLAKHPAFGNRLIQIVVVKESSRHKLVKSSVFSKGTSANTSL